MKTAAGVFAALLLGAAYLLNLGSGYAPTNGDEMVYLHIARLTSENGHWLPLVSDLQTPQGSEMRNTKPPLVFWQAMWAGQWSWNLFTLRLPYALQTLMTAAWVAWLATHLMRVRTSFSLVSDRSPLSPAGRSMMREPLGLGLLAAALYLGFFATYRYGRPVLTSATESFFLFMPAAALLLKLSFWKAHPARLAGLFGVAMIPALWVKSFALAAPVGLWLLLALWLVHADQHVKIKRVYAAAWPATLAVLLAVGGFALWFAVDPDPASVWREFIVGENFSNKFQSHDKSYWQSAMKGADSMWGLWLSPLVNAGLLFPLVVGLLAAAWRARSQSAMPERLLWLWIFAWLFVFMWPSQRSARYVIPAMPAVAVLIALYADRIGRVWWQITLGLVLVATAALAWVAWCLDGVFAASMGYSLGYGVGLGALLLCCCTAMVYAAWRKAGVAISAIAWLVLLGALASPFDQGMGRFEAKVAQRMAGEKIAVPENFNAQSERFQFALPATPRIRTLPYAAGQTPPASDWIVHTQALAAPISPSALASRLVLRGRHQSGEVTWAALSNPLRLQALLVEREVVTASTAALVSVLSNNRVTVDAR